MKKNDIKLYELILDMTNNYGRVLITNIYDRTSYYSCDNMVGYNKHLKKYPNMVELIGGCHQIKPVFDVDSYGIPIDIDDVKQKINLMFPDKKIAIASREPRVCKDKTKYSLRAYVIGIRISYYNLKQLILDNGYENNKPFDMSIYDSNKILFVPLTTQKDSEHYVPPLVPIDCEVFDCCASYILEEYDNWDTKFEKNEIVSVKKVMPHIIDDFDDEDDNPDKYSRLSKLIALLKPSRSDNYDTWTKFYWCIRKICEKEKISRRKCIELIHQFSKLSKDNYYEDKVDKFIDENWDKLRETGYAWNYLLHTCIKDDNPTYYETISKSYFNLKKEFELTHTKIMFPPHYVSLTSKGYDLQTEDGFKKSFRHITCSYKTINKKGETEYQNKRFIDKWLDDPKIRKYERLVFNPPPKTIETNEFNVWEDFNVLNVTNDNDTRNYWEEYKAYGLNLIGNINELNLVLARYALRIQKPAVRSNICIVYYGKERIGKNRFLSVIKKILGKYYLDLDDAKKLYEKHALHEFQRLLICVNEAQGIENFQNADILKTRITEPDITVNPKGITPYTIDNYCDYDMTTNSFNCVKVTDESFERFMQIQCTDHYLGNTKFFTDYINNIENNPIAIKQIYEGFKNFDVSAIVPTGNFQKDKPITKMDKEIRFLNKDKLILFLEEITRNHIKKHYGNNKVLNSEITYSNSQIFKIWCQWLIDCKFKNHDNIDSHKFGMKLSKLQKDKLEDDTIIKDNKHSKTSINYGKLMKYFEIRIEDIDIEKFLDDYNME